MLQPWMVKSNFRYINSLFELYFYYRFLFFKNFSFLKNTPFRDSFHFLNIISVFFLNKKKNSPLGIVNFLHYNFKKDFLFKFDFLPGLEPVFSAPQNIFFFKNKSCFIANFLNIFFSFNYASLGDFFSPNFRFRLLFMYTLKKKAFVVNFNKFLSKWLNGFNFFFAIFYYDTPFLLFGSPFFKNETLAFNREFSSIDTYTWNYVFPLFFIKQGNFDKKIDIFLRKFKTFDISFFIVVDTIYHFKNLFHFKRHKYFSCGLIDAKQDPLTMSFALPVFNLDLIAQLFFFKFLLSIYNLTLKLKYKNFLFFWKNINLKFYLKA